jgi:lipopolysaccharide export system protein LptA
VGSWQKRLRAVLAVVMLGIIGVVGYTMRPREVRVAPTPTQKLEAKETIRTIGGAVIQLKGASKNVGVEFKEQVTYEDGTTKLIGVKIGVDNRGGRNFVVTADEAHIGKDQSSFDAKGHVHLTSDDGFEANAETATYAEAEKIVKAPGPVTYKQGRMSGSGVGFLYDTQRNTLWLSDQAVVDFAKTDTADEMHVKAGAAGFARTDRYMRFEKGTHLERAGQIIDSTDAMVFLFQDRDEPDRIELRGEARITGSAGLGTLQSMSARDLNLDYRDDGRSLQQATLAGNANIQMAPKNGVPGQRMTGEFMDISLNEDGSLSNLSSRDNVVVTLPATKDTPARTIRSTSLTAKGAPGEGLTSMTFQDGVTYNEAATKEHGARAAKSRVLDAKLDGPTGALKEATFTGGFRFDENTMHATSETATYQIDAGRLVLAASKGATAPQIADDTLTIDAESLDITLSPRRMSGKGNVKTLLQPSAKKAGQKDAVNRPGLLGETEIVNVMADSLQYDEETRKGTYSGNARLFQGDTAIKGEQIVLDETKGDLSATSTIPATPVTTILVIVDPDAAKDAKPTTTLVQAATFTYSDQTRQAIYETLVHMNGTQGDLRAGKITLFLDKEKNSLTKLDAVGMVTASVDKRTTTGNDLNYSAADEQYVFHGAPVKMIDADCQETTGKTLTFFKSSARVIVDGNEEVRTQTKGGGKCPQTPPE